METRCRQCEACLKKRAAHWRLRAQTEHAAASRTWFGTLTFRPDVHAHLINQCRAYYIHNGLDYDRLSEKDQFKKYHQLAAKELQLFYKRLRKAGARFRYLQVAEKHKSGLIHFHVLIHEVSPDHPARHALLTGQWLAGFSNFKLATEAKQVTYLLKYLTKTQGSAVRASLRYGIPPNEETSAAKCASSTLQTKL